MVDGVRGVTIVQDVVQPPVVVGVIVGGDDVVERAGSRREDGIEVGQEFRQPLAAGPSIYEDCRTARADDKLARALADVYGVDLELLGRGGCPRGNGNKPRYEKSMYCFLLKTILFPTQQHKFI